MDYSERHFKGSITRLVDCAWSIRLDRAETIVHPDGYSDLLLAGNGAVYVSGTASRTHRLKLAYGCPLNGIRLRFGSIPFLLGISASSIADQIRPVNDFSSSFARAVVSAAQRADSGEQLRDAVIDLLAKESRDRTEDPRLAFITSGSKRRSLRSTALALGVTERHLHRLVMHEVGVCPSRLRKIQRLQRLIDAMRRQNPGQTMATLAHNHGFFDQAHMNHEVKDLTAISPGALYQSLSHG